MATIPEIQIATTHVQKEVYAIRFKSTFTSLNKYITPKNDINIKIRENEPKNIKSIKMIFSVYICKQAGNEFILPKIDKVKIHWNDKNVKYEKNSESVSKLYIINTEEIDINNIPFLKITKNNFTYGTMYTTNVKSKNEGNVNNIILSGDITSCYNRLPDGIDTINEAPIPEEYLENESYMNLSNINDIDLNRFGELDEGKFIKQKIYLSKIIVNESNKIKVENSEMQSRNESKIDDVSNTYAFTEIEVSEELNEKNIVKEITFLDDDTVRLELDGNKSDF